MKKKKLNLKELKVKSFITNSEELNLNTINGKGRAEGTHYEHCSFDPCNNTFLADNDIK